MPGGGPEPSPCLPCQGHPPPSGFNPSPISHASNMPAPRPHPQVWALETPPAPPRRMLAFPPRYLKMRFQVAASYRVPTVLQGLAAAPKTTCLWSSQQSHKAGLGDPMFQVKKLRQRKRRGIQVTSPVSGSSGQCLLLDKGHHRLSLSSSGCSQSPLQGLRSQSCRPLGDGLLMTQLGGRQGLRPSQSHIGEPLALRGRSPPAPRP